MTETQRERELVTSMLRSLQRWERTNEEEAWLELEERSLEWEIEWKIATGVLDTNIVRIRPRTALPQISEANVLKWRRAEKRLNLTPLVRLREVTEALTIPQPCSEAQLQAWKGRLEARKHELVRVTRAEVRAQLFSDSDKRQQWQH